MALFFHRFWRNLFNTFREYWKWHAIAIILTAIAAISGFDWEYLVFFRGTSIYRLLFPAVIIGGFLPYLAPVILLVIGRLKKNLRMINAAFALGQAEFLGLLITSFYKFFTGRIPPPGLFSSSPLKSDVSSVFHFGIYRESIFWGWPSSHTAVAFAGVFALITLFPQNKLVRYAGLLYAFYIGIGVSMSIHWFSDFLAGAIIGIAIGLVVGKSFASK